MSERRRKSSFGSTSGFSPKNSAVRPSVMSSQASASSRSAASGASSSGGSTSDANDANDANESVEFTLVRAVIWVDSTPLLKAEQVRLRATKQKLNVAEERVKQHKQSDEPLYQKWFNETFSKRLAEIRELYEKLANLDTVVHRVEREILSTGCSAVEAYQRVMRDEDEITIMEKLEAEAQERAEANARAEAAARESGDESGDEYDEDDGDSFSRSFEDSRRRAENDEKSANEEWRAKTKKSSDQDDHLKSVYRSLVRRLHPDLNPDLSEDLKERWFDVQDAYEERDLARLESLLAACEDGGIEGDDSFIDRIQSLTRLKALFKSVTKKLKAQQRTLQQLKKAPAWEFTKVKKDPRRLAYLERDVKFELRNAEETLSSDIRTLQYQIDRWTRSSEPRGRRRNKKDLNLSFEW